MNKEYRNKVEIIRKLVSQIDINKIEELSKKYPKNKSLRKLPIYHFKILIDNLKESDFDKICSKLAYCLLFISNPQKFVTKTNSLRSPYIKNKKENNKHLSISYYLFKLTYGIKNEDDWKYVDK